ncbi:MAG: hypothetical protein JWQ27_3023 [Ferruginibacter sp.]|nr:hypothetical protein [Ferruginibacter sp.]
MFLEPSQKFCPACGQKTDTHRLTMPHFSHELFHAFTHTDKSIFQLLKQLATRPGTTAREYIQGKRVSYFNPFTFFLILMGLFVFSNMYFKPPMEKREPDPRVLQYMPNAQAKAQYISMMHRVNNAMTVFQKHGNVVAMIAVPFFSLFTWAFFRRKKYNYAEHLTANMLFIAFSNLIFTIVIFPLQAMIHGPAQNVFIIGAMLLQAVYIAWSLNGFLLLAPGWPRVKSFAVSLFCVGLWLLFSLTVMALYIYQNGDFYKFFGRMMGAK